jgi:HAD superfamily hydrolase (TIGR01458 family)
MRIDGLLFDIDGTLCTEEAPIEGAPELLQALRARGMVFRYLTNTTRYSRRGLLERLRSFGFPAEHDDLFTAPTAAVRWLERNGIERIATYVPDTAREDFEDFGFDPIRPQAIVVGDLGERWDFRTLNRAFRQVLDGAVLVALQKNRYWHTARGLELDAGPFVAALEYATDREAVVVGKPAREFFDLAVESTGLRPEQLAVVGDDVDSDIGGAHDAALRGILVRTGKFRQEGLDQAGTVPHAILDSVAHLPEILG